AAQQGRYTFHVRNGVLPTSLTGTVKTAGGTAVSGSLLNLCNTTECRHDISDALGNYRIVDVPDGQWGLVAFPPAGSTLFPATAGPGNLVIQNGQLVLQSGQSANITNLVLTAMHVPRAGVSIGPPLVPGLTGQTVVA